MAFYTELVKDICEQYAGKTGPYGEIIPLAQPKVFDFSYPEPEGGVTKDAFEQGFLKHFYMREIGLETVDYWKLKLDDKLNTIMPYYNKLLVALSKQYDFLLPTEYNETVESNDTTHNEENSTENATNNSTSESNANSQMIDTPQSDGNYIVVTRANYNGKSLKTRYAHLSEIDVYVGDTVTPSTIIGKTGNTGNSYGSHLHFEVIYDGVRRNPLVWLDSDFTVANSNVFTFSSGEHSVEIPAEKTQTITIKNIPNRIAYLIYDEVKQRDIESHYVSTYSDQFQTTQDLTISELSGGDAMAIWGICVNTGYGANYTSEYD